jgi:hypothetical protein
VNAAPTARMTVSIDNCRIEDNRAGKDGGGAHVRNPGKTSRIRFDGCRFHANRAPRHGSFFVNDPNQDCTFSNCVFE